MGNGARPEKGELRAPLRRLLLEPEAAGPLKVWRALTVAERREGIEAALGASATDGHNCRPALVELVARQHRFRVQTVDGWSDERIADHAARLVPRSAALASQLLFNLHVGPRRALLRDYLDGLGISHEDGRLDEEAHEANVTEGQAREAAARLLERHPADLVATYFLTLIGQRQFPSLVPGIAGWLEKDFLDATAGAAASAAEDDTRLAEDDLRPRTEEPDEDAEEFTTLDGRMIRMVVDVAQGVEGALHPDQIDDLVGEVISLNSGRHRSYFHAGFADVVLGRSARRELPAQNDSRLCWYWAGYVNGLARQSRHGEIVACYDSQEAVRKLGSVEAAGGAAEVAARHVFQALCHSGRSSEAAAFLDPETFVRVPPLFPTVSEEGTRLLRDDDAAEARELFDLLQAAMERLVALGYDPTSPPFLAARRRRAHCLRQLGQMERAREVLERLLEEESDPEIRAMVFTDLGLIEASFRRLASLRVPSDREEADSVSEALARGEAKFRQSAAIEARYAAHGHYCLGVLALVRDEYEEAIDHLDIAWSLFTSQPPRYEQGGLLATARLYLGMAICLGLEGGRMRRASQLIRRALEDGARIPSYLLPGVLTALEMESDDLARKTAEALLDESGPQVLDALLETDAAAGSRTVIEALSARADDEQRGQVERAEDYLRLVPLLLGIGWRDRAATALDHLEEAARSGIVRDEFLEILEDPRRHDGVWTVEEARLSRVQVLESAGRYQEAVAVLEEEFRRILSEAGFGAADDAAALLEHARSYGLPEERFAQLTARLDSFRRARTPEPPIDEEEEPAAPVDILFVGGNEQQEKYQQRIRERLAELDPQVRIAFIHPGWSGNWSRSLEETRRRLVGMDGVVISRFIRTEFGRQLRSDLQVPWRGCHGTGRDSMVRSILLAAEMARQALQGD